MRGPTPLEFLFISLRVVWLRSGKIIAKQKHLPVRKIEVHVEGELDTDVLMVKAAQSGPVFLPSVF